MNIHMNDLLTTDEAAAYLRMSERKLYELVSTGAVPCTKVTGRWLFPRAALDHWVLAGMADGPGLPADAPPIIGGSQDSLLEWALRTSTCGLAALPEGSESGLRRLSRGEVIAAGIHLHRLTDDDERANVETVVQTPGLHDAVVIAFARREQGLLVAPGNKLKLIDIASVVHKKARMAHRQPGAGAQLLLLRLLNSAGLSPDAVTKTEPEFATGPDLAHAVRGGRADCGIAPRSAAREAGLDFVPLVWERFDLVLRQRDYFRPGPQALLTFMRTAAFAERAAELSGYDTTDSGAVRQLS
jgi:excisionase family DNA binding protein